MRKRLTMALAVALLAGLLPMGYQALAVTCPDVSPPPLEFGERIYIDRNRAGGEPVSIVADDGSINVSAHAGTTHIYKDPAGLAGAEDFAYGYTNQTLNWRSDDGGRSWEYVGLAGLREGPHSATSTGFSDPDYAIDAGGTIYNTEIDLVNVAVFSSVDDGQSYTFANPEVSAGDRPWLAAGDAGEVFLYINLPKQLWRSTDGGITWMLQGRLSQVGIDAKPYNDPLNLETGLIGPAGDDGIAITADEGVTWERFPGAGLGPNTDFFGSMAVDKAGYVYRAAAGGYTRSDYENGHVPDGRVTFNYFDRRTESWGDAVDIAIPDGDALWPWVVAGDDGRAAVVWYQNFAGEPDKFYAMAAYTTNAHGSTVTCSDGEERFVPPQFSVTNASKTPVHVGTICLNGTTCNVNYGTDFVRGDRRLGDFFTVNYDKDGTLFIVSGDTTLRSPTGGPKPVGNPIFIKATSGAPLLEQPRDVRDTRCLYPLGDVGLCDDGP